MFFTMHETYTGEGVCGIGPGSAPVTVYPGITNQAHHQDQCNKALELFKGVFFLLPLSLQLSPWNLFLLLMIRATTPLWRQRSIFSRVVTAQAVMWPLSCVLLHLYTFTQAYAKPQPHHCTCPQFLVDSLTQLDVRTFARLLQMMHYPSPLSLLSP